MSLSTIQSIDKKYKMYPTYKGKYLEGEIIDEIDDITPEQCNYNCSDLNGKCLWTTYDVSTKKCLLHGIDNVHDAIVGIKSDVTYDRYNGKFGDEILSKDNLTMTDINTCEQMCTNNENCEAYQFLSPNHCYQVSFKENPNMTNTWKTEIKESKLNKNEMNALNCCLNKGTNCDELTPQSKICDSKMKELCNKYPHLEECKCLIRTNDHQFNRLKKILEKETGSEWNDECWYTPCIKIGDGSSDNSKSYIPSNMMPIKIQNSDGTEIDNLNCIKKKSICTLDDLYNVNFKNDCKNTTIQGFKQLKTNSFYIIAYLGFLILFLLLIKK